MVDLSSLVEKDNTTANNHAVRLCKVNGRYGFLHCFEQYADVIAPGLTVGSQQGGQFSRMFGIVEFSDGSVERVNPPDIKFCDEKNKLLSILENHNKD